jgi:hypothetical protein
MSCESPADPHHDSRYDDMARFSNVAQAARASALPTAAEENAFPRGKPLTV